ncbi:MAG: metal-sensing transcriptional repressor [Verrucomicrobiota bacterium]
MGHGNCFILTQIAAVRSTLDTLVVELLTNHLESCVLSHGSGTEHKCAKSLTKKNSWQRC